MSNAVLPHYVGFKIEIDKTPMWSTRIADPVAGQERRVQQQLYPKYRIGLTVEVLRDAAGTDEAKTLLGFFNLRAGAFDSFLYTDPDDNTVTDQQFGVGNGVATQFQLVRAFPASGGFIEPVQNVNVLTNIKKNGVAQTDPADFSISYNGLVTFTAPPGNGLPLTWTGTYYWRVRFEEDKLTFRRIFRYLWELKNLPLVGSVMNKV